MLDVKRTIRIIELSCGIGIFILLMVIQQIKHGHGTPGIKRTAFNLKKIMIQMIQGRKINITRCVQIAFVCIISTLAKINVFYRFWNNKMEICVSLTVRMRDHINGNAICSNGNICTVIIIKSTQKYLLSLSTTGMLCYKEPRNFS